MAFSFFSSLTAGLRSGLHETDLELVLEKGGGAEVETELYIL